MIKLLQFPAPPSEWGISNASPFCVKVETYLRMVELPFENVPTPDPRKMPKGKLPCIEDKGKLIADSGVIINYLKETYGDKLDADLNARDKAFAHTVRRMVEEHLYWPVLYSRWIYEPSWPTVKSAFFGSMPAMVRLVVPDLIRKDMLKKLQAQGVGRHSESEIWELARTDLAALSEMLGDKTHFLGDRPRSIDATLYGFLAQLVFVPLNSPVKSQIEAFPNLVAYARRMREQYFLAKK